MRLAHFVVPPLAGLMLLALPSASSAQISVDLNITLGPPELPVYDQPPIPGPGYIWTPGYWAYGPDGYYWVPGTWVEPPRVGLLWTPGYWGCEHDIYVFHAGYWGPHIGFYGGINYGFGYVGIGYEGGHWDHGVFAYNSTVNNFGGAHITNVYNKTVINNTTVTRVSFNGGAGTAAQPTPQEQAALHEPHTAPTGVQVAHAQAASTNRELLASVNHGTPSIAATARPGRFSGNEVVHAHEATAVNPPGGRPGPEGHPAPGGPGRPRGAAPQAATLSPPHPGGTRPPHPPGPPPRANATRVPPHPPGHPPQGQHKEHQHG